jgi:hypothetical protein
MIESGRENKTRVDEWKDAVETEMLWRWRCCGDGDAVEMEMRIRV